MRGGKVERGSDSRARQRMDAAGGIRYPPLDSGGQGAIPYSVLILLYIYHLTHSLLFQRGFDEGFTGSEAY